MSIDAARLTAVISPLRRALLAGARRREQLPDIPDAQVELVRALPRGASATPGELAEQLGVGKSTISNLLRAMERDGLVVRRPGSIDRRSVDVATTDTAHGYFDRFDAASAQLVHEATELLPADAVEALAAAVPALEQLRDALTDLAQRAEPDRVTDASDRRRATPGPDAEAPKRSSRNTPSSTNPSKEQTP